MAEYDWTIKQGQTETLTLTYEADLTGYQVRAQGRETFESTATVFSATSSPAAGIVFTAGATSSSTTARARQSSSRPCAAGSS